MRQTLCILSMVLSACASSPERRAVDLSKPYQVGASQSVHLTDEAQKACNTRKMRRRILDNNPHNDQLPITVISPIGEGRRMMTDMTVDCRNVVAMRLLSENDRAVAAPSNLPSLTARHIEEPIIQDTQRPSVNADPAQQRVISAHRVETGETLYQVAQKHCVDYNAIAILNGLHDPSQIKVGDVLVLPEDSC